MQPQPRSVPRTIENTRELDETVCKPDDEEVFSLILENNFNSFLSSSGFVSFLSQCIVY
jgi:ribosome production factor 1